MNGWGELRLTCRDCGAPVTVYGYVGDLDPHEPHHCLDCRHALQDARDLARAHAEQSAFQTPEDARRPLAYNELPEGY